MPSQVSKLKDAPENTKQEFFEKTRGKNIESSRYEPIISQQ